MSRAAWRCRCRAGMVVLASGALISLSALTGGIAPALAGPGPIMPTIVPAPPPRPAPPPPPAPRPAPPPPPAPRPAPPPRPAPREVPQAPVHDAAPDPVQTAPPPRVHDAAPDAPNPEAAPPVTRNEPATPHDTAAPPDIGAPNQPGIDAPSPRPTGPQPNEPAPKEPVPNEPAPAVVRPLPGQTPGPRSGSAPQNGAGPNSAPHGAGPNAAQNGAGPNSAPHGAGPGGQVVTVHQATTTQAPQQDVATAEASVPVEHKPDPAPATDVNDLRNKVDLRDKVQSPPTDANQWNRRGQDWRAPGPDRPDSDQHQWDHQVRQWDRNWVRYDEDYRPIICNPYQSQLQIVYDYDGAPQIVVIPPLGSTVLDAAEYGAYNFTALVLDAAGEAVDAAVGSFFGGGYDPGYGLLPPPPSPLTTYDDVPIAVDYPDATYDPFIANQVVDAGPDPQYGEDKALLDGVTPVWGDWGQTPDGQREFDVHKTQQFPGLDAPAPGPLPGNYQLHLASKATPARDLYVVAASAVVATLGLCAAVAMAISRRRRRRAWYYPLPR
jgi:hypothetical protein